MWMSLRDADSAGSWSLIVEGLARAGVDVPQRVPAAASGDNSFFLAELAAGISVGNSVT